MSSAGTTIRRVAELVEEFGESDRVYVVALSDDLEPDDDSFVLMFQVAEPDREGTGYCVVAEPGQRTAYRAIVRCDLYRDTLRLRFAEGAAAALELPPNVELGLAVPPSEVHVLRQGLARVGVLAVEQPIDQSDF